MSTQLIERIRAIVDDGSISRSGLARASGLHANSLRDLDSPGWNPTAETLRKLENWLAHGSDLSPMATPEEIIAEARNGRMFILVDDEDRENEGDLVIPAQMATPDAVNFMATHGRGLICLTLTKARVDQLGLELMSRQNGTRHETAFTTSVEAREGVTTGISAADRARTVSVAIDASKGRDDIVTPGHVFPLIARDGGVLLRSGHTEAAVDLCKLSGLPPVGVISELMNDDGTVMKGEQVAKFAATHKLKHVTIADMIAYRQAREKLIERVSTFTTESPIGLLQGYAYRSPFDSIAHVAFVYNGIGDGRNVLTRFHKPNIVKDIFTGPKRMQAVLEHFKKNGSGVLIYLRDGAAGVPVAPLPEDKSAEADRNKQWREVGVGAQILRDLGVTSIRHLTSSVHDYKGLSGFGIEILSNEQLEG